MALRNLVIAVVVIGLTGWFLALSFRDSAGETPAGPLGQLPPAATATPMPTATGEPTPVPTPLPPPPAHARICLQSPPSPQLTEKELLGQEGRVVARIYCDGPELRYVNFIDGRGEVTRTTLFREGRPRVKLYYINGDLHMREDFDAEGYPVPDRSDIPLPSSRIGPGR